MTPGLGSTYMKLIFTTFFWGGTFVAAKWAVQEAPPFHAASYRFAIATFTLFSLVAWQTWGRDGNGKFPVPRGSKEWLRLFLLGLTGIFLYNAIFFTGLKWTTAANGSLIVAINPMVTALLSALWLKETIRPIQGVGFALSFLGVITVISKGSWEALQQLSFNPGDLLLLGAPLSWAIYSILGKKVLGSFSPLVATAYAALFGALLLIPAAGLERVYGLGGADFSWIGWLAILQLALLGTVMGFVWWYEGVKVIGAGRTSVFVNLVPVFGTLLAALFLGESILWPQMLGGMMVVGGVYLGTVMSSLQPDKTAETQRA